MFNAIDFSIMADQFQTVDIEKIRNFMQAQRQLEKEEYKKKIFWIIVGVVIFAVLILILTFLKIYWDYQQYLNEGKTTKESVDEDLKESNRLRDLENKLKHGKCGKYQWTQSEDEVELIIPLSEEFISEHTSHNNKSFNPTLLKSKDITCIFKSRSILIQINSVDILKGTFCGDIIPFESSWQFGVEIQNIDDGSEITSAGIRTIEISIKKKGKQFGEANVVISKRKKELEPLWGYILKEYDGDGVDAPLIDLNPAVCINILYTQ